MDELVAVAMESSAWAKSMARVAPAPQFWEMRLQAQSAQLTRTPPALHPGNPPVIRDRGPCHAKRVAPITTVVEDFEVRTALARAALDLALSWEDGVFSCLLRDGDVSQAGSQKQGWMNATQEQESNPVRSYLAVWRKCARW